MGLSTPAVGPTVPDDDENVLSQRHPLGVDDSGFSRSMEETMIDRPVFPVLSAEKLTKETALGTVEKVVRQAVRNDLAKKGLNDAIGGPEGVQQSTVDAVIRRLTAHIYSRYGGNFIKDDFVDTSAIATTVPYYVDEYLRQLSQKPPLELDGDAA